MVLDGGGLLNTIYGRLKSTFVRGVWCCEGWILVGFKKAWVHTMLQGRAVMVDRAGIEVEENQGGICCLSFAVRDKQPNFLLYFLVASD